MSRALQSALKAAGFDPGPIDGVVGGQTKAAIKAFQKARFLVEDGVAGPATLAALDLGGQTILDPTAFHRFAPHALPQTREALEAAIWSHPDLVEPAVLDDWLGQMHVESKGFSTLVENLNYSVEGLRKTFGRHRISDAECARYGRIDGERPADQEAIANIVYGGEFGRTQLGNTQPGDGWAYRGSGLKQITGRANTEASGYSAEEMRRSVWVAADAAADFFVRKGCVAPARLGDMTRVTRIITGGMTGHAERGRMTAAAQKVIVR